MQPMRQTIDRLEKPSAETVFRHYVRRNRPVVLAGIADEWRALSTWTPDYFRTAFADLGVNYATWDGSPGDDPAVYLRQRKILQIKLGAYIEQMRLARDPRAYLLNYPLFRHVPQLTSDIGTLDDYMGLRGFYPKAIARRLKEDPRFFLGPAATVSFLHFDGYNNFFVQVYGRKTFLLLSPAQSRSVYYPWSYPNVHYSPVNVEDPDFEKFPLFKDARMLEATLAPGDILFIPVRWWHYARALDESISLNFWWYSISTMLRLWHPMLIYGSGKVRNHLRRRFSKPRG